MSEKQETLDKFAAIRSVLEQVTAIHIGDPRLFNEAVAAISYLDELREAYVSR